MSTDTILGVYGKEMTWEMKAGVMGKRQSRLIEMRNYELTLYPSQLKFRLPNICFLSSRTYHWHLHHIFLSATRYKTPCGLPYHFYQGFENLCFT